MKHPIDPKIDCVFIVVKGAEMLLSEELRGQIPDEDESPEDDD